MTYTAAEKLKEVERELALRNRLYPRWIGAGTMKQEAADRHLSLMEAIRDDYRAAVEKERLL